MDFSEVSQVIYRSIMSLIALFLLTKMLGKRQVSQLSVFDYIVGISIGSIAAEMDTNIDIPYVNGLVAMAIYTFIAYGVSYATRKSIKLRRYFTGAPIILIEKGKILESQLKKALLNVNDLLSECRGGGYFDIDQLEYVVMESSGALSFLPRSEYIPLTPNNLGMNPISEGLTSVLIVDGKILENNLKEIDKTEEWLLSTLKKQGYKSLERILLVTTNDREQLKIYEKNKYRDPKNILE